MTAKPQKLTRLWTEKINGKTHVAYQDEKGRRVYDPPLPRHYQKLWADRFQEMCDNNTAPRALTDREFFAGMGTLADQFKGDDRGLKWVVDGAKRQGYTPKPTDVYCPSIAMNTGDPKAFVQTTGDIRRVCEERGMDCHGAVNVRAQRDPEPVPSQTKRRLADDIALQEVRRRVKKNPDLLNKATVNDIKADVIQDHGHQ